MLDALRSVTAQNFVYGHQRIFMETSHDDCSCDSPVGVAANRNRVLDHQWAKICQYVIFLDADDTIPKNYVEELLRTADRDDCVVACGAKLFGLEEREVPVRTPVNLDTLLESNTVHCSALIPLKHFRAVGGFCTDLPSHEDWDLWCQLAALGVEFRTCKSTYLNYRRHAGSRSKQNPNGFWEAKIRLNNEYQRVTW